MTTFMATAEGGTNGSSVQTSDSGSGQAWDGKSVGTGAAFTYSSSGNCRRNAAGLCYAFSVGASSVTARVTWNVNGGASAADQWYQMYLDPADLSATCILGRGMDSTSVTQRWRIRFQSSTIILADQSTTTVATSTALSNGTRYRVLWRVAGSSSGACRLWVFIGDSLTATYDSGEVTGKNFSGVIQTVHWGIAASATSQNGKIDDAVFSDVGDPGPTTKTLAAAAMTGTSTVSASSKVSVNVSAAMTGSATVAASSKVAVNVSAALSGRGTLTATPKVVVKLSAALSGALSMAATARVSVAVAAALNASASLSAALKQVANVSAALTGSGSVGATLTRVVTLGAVMTATGSLEAVAIVTVVLSADLSGVAALTVELTTVRTFSPTPPRAGSITVPRSGVVTRPRGA